MRAAFLTGVQTLVLTLASVATADDWTQWRGPSFNGSAEATGLPVTWSAGESLAWKTELPGPSAATPATIGDRIFITAFDEKAGSIHALGVERATGRILWSDRVGEGRSGPRKGL